MHRVTKNPRLCAAIALAVLSPFCCDSCYVMVRGSALRAPLPPRADRPPRAVAVYSWGWADALREALAQTGAVVVVPIGTPDSLFVSAELVTNVEMNTTTWLSMATLTLLPGYQTEVRELRGTVTQPDGTSRTFSIRREDTVIMQMPLLLLPGLFTNNTSPSSQLGDLPQALVAWLADEGLL